jgi:hypothetical protein
MDATDIAWAAAAVGALIYIFAQALKYPDGKAMGRSRLDDAFDSAEERLIRGKAQAKKHLAKLVGRQRKDD